MNFMYRSDGLKGLWRGCLLDCSMAGPFGAVEFFAYESMKVIVKGDQTDHELTHWERIQCGASSGTAAAIIICPMAVLRTNYMMQ